MELALRLHTSISVYSGKAQETESYGQAAFIIYSFQKLWVRCESNSSNRIFKTSSPSQAGQQISNTARLSIITNFDNRRMPSCSKLLLELSGNPSIIASFVECSPSCVRSLFQRLQQVSMEMFCLRLSLRFWQFLKLQRYTLELYSWQYAASCIECTRQCTIDSHLSMTFRKLIEKYHFHCSMHIEIR